MENLDPGPTMKVMAGVCWQDSRGHGKTWKVMEFKKSFFQTWKVMDSSHFGQGHGKVMEFAKFIKINK